MQEQDKWSRTDIGEDEMVRLVIEEDRRRASAFVAAFDPESGIGSPGRRIEVFHPELRPSRQFIPASMEALAEVAALRNGLPLERVFGVGTAEDGLKKWMRMRCRHDFPYWAFKTIRLTAKGGGDPRPMVLNAPQRKLAALFDEMLEAGQPIRAVIVKARQWGGSTLTQLYMLWIQLMRKKGFNSLIVAHQAAGTEEILNMAKNSLDRYPRELLADDGEEMGTKEKVYVSGGFSRAALKVERRNCRIKVGSAERPHSSRGGDYSLVHLSEVGLWSSTSGKNAVDVVRAATSGVLLEPETMVVMESTADGVGSFFHKEYLAAKRGTSLYKLMFVAWHEIEKYAQCLGDDERESLARSLVAHRHEDQASDDRCAAGSYLWNLWMHGVRLDALAWYVGTRSSYGTQDQMASEYPSFDSEAFVSSDAQVFSSAKVEALRAGCCEPKAKGDLTARGASGDLALEGIEFSQDSNGWLHVWEMPDTDKTIDMYGRYLVVVDVGGRGLRADWSVIAVFDRIMTSFGGGPTIVAQWRGHCDMDILAWKAAQIARWYCDALLVIESNTMETRDRDRSVEGDQSKYILNLVRESYPNLYARSPSPEDIALGRPTKYGFHTNVSTKPMIISNLVMAVRDRLYTERVAGCLDEYLTYRRKPNGSYAAESGHHDDMLMTRAIGLHVAWHDMDPYRPVKRR